MGTLQKDVQIMAILNLTPDSFFDGGKYQHTHHVLQKVEQYVLEGADILDLGAYSSKPGAIHISPQEEHDRLLPVLKEVKKHFPHLKISIDTFRSEIAVLSIQEGAHIINDISGGNMDPKMFEAVSKLSVPYILMHMNGTPQNMQNNLSEGDVKMQIKDFFKKKLDLLYQNGIENVILDVGFGFGKTVNQNFDLLKHLSDFQLFNKPILVGLSRKSMLYKTLNLDPTTVLNATTVVHTLAILNGADILRVHDVKEAKETIEIIKKYHQ